MATRAAMIDMEHAARQRIIAATNVLAERFGIVPTTPPFERAPELRAIRDLECQADLLDGIVAATGGNAAPDASTAPPDDDSGEDDVDDLSVLTVAQLKTKAGELGIEGVGSLRTKPELIAAIEEALTAPGGPNGEGA